MVFDLFRKGPSKEEIALLRDLLGRATAHVSFKSLHLLAARCGFEISVSADTIYRFSKEEIARLNRDDVANLLMFLTQTQTGLALCGDVRKSDLSAYAELVSTLFKGATTSWQYDLTGDFYIVYATPDDPRYFFVRDFEVTVEQSGLITVEETWQSQHTLQEQTVQRARIERASGIMTFVRGRANILLTEITALEPAFRLIVCDQFAPTNVPAERITGQMLGMSPTGEHYSRAVLISRKMPSKARRDNAPASGRYAITDISNETLKKDIELLQSNLPRPSAPDGLSGS